MVLDAPVGSQASAFCSFETEMPAGVTPCWRDDTSIGSSRLHFAMPDNNAISLAAIATLCRVELQLVGRDDTSIGSSRLHFAMPDNNAISLAAIATLCRVELQLVGYRATHNRDVSQTSNKTCNRAEGRSG
eukprot:s1377_g3.t1